ncbi:MAG: TadE/TadG family type IV pilus assembly protein [Gemmataceae bacterium]
MLRRQPTRRRTAATVVEAAFVLSICLLFLFGILEYGRFVMTLQVMENAAREGARFAVVNTNEATTADVIARVNQKMAGVQNSLTNYNVTVTGIILRPKPGETAGDLLPDWTNASTTDGIQVEVTGAFQPILPSFLQMGAFPLRSRSVMYSEGN